MAARFLLPRTKPAFGVGLGLSSIFAVSTLQLFRQPSRLIRCDAPTAALHNYQRDAKAPVVRDGKLNPQIFGQISTGSVLGLLGGVAVGFFSKPLTILIGLLLLGAQVLESRGIHIIPYKTIQKTIKGIDVNRAVRDNVAFKLSFSATFLLAGFAHF